MRQGRDAGPLDGEPDAELDPWCPCEVENGKRVLFGFGAHHPLTGGGSWMASSPVRAIDQGRCRARTASGRLYALGHRAELGDMPEEAQVAHALLVLNPVAKYDPTPLEADAIEWLTACKAARWLGLATPPRGDQQAVRDFLRQNGVRYLALRSGRRPS